MTQGMVCRVPDPVSDSDSWRHLRFDGHLPSRATQTGRVHPVLESLIPGSGQFNEPQNTLIHGRGDMCPYREVNVRARCDPRDQMQIEDNDEQFQVASSSRESLEPDSKVTASSRSQSRK
jgi:hypothetical protein